jgi:hypothetical protein
LHEVLLRRQDKYRVVDPGGNRFEVPLTKGSFKDQPNNPTRPDGSEHEYCPVPFVAAEMTGLIEKHAEHQRNGVPPEISAAWLHHAFTQIHPFSDGNGRVARALTSAVLIKAGLFPFVAKDAERNRYIDALESADAGDLERLIGFIRQAQRNAIVEIGKRVRVSISGPKEVRTMKDSIEAIKADLVNRGKLAAPALAEMGRLAHEKLMSLGASADGMIGQAAQGLTEQLSSLDKRLSFPQETGEFPMSEVSIWPLPPGLWAARKRSRLYFHPPGDRLELYMYPVGTAPQGLAGAHFSYNDLGSGRIVGDAFLVYSTEDIESLGRRFGKWFERRLAEALEIWKNRITL